MWLLLYIDLGSSWLVTLMQCGNLGYCGNTAVKGVSPARVIQNAAAGDLTREEMA